MAQCEETTTRFPTVVTLSGLFGARLLNDRNRKYRPQLVELVNGQDNYPKPSKIVSLSASAPSTTDFDLADGGTKTIQAPCCGKLSWCVEE
jgi:hypothetical protein